MKELSLNILDISENSCKAGASLIEILLFEDIETLTLIIKDNGCGMTDDVLKSISDPFYTTRTTRKVGMGIPLLKLAAEMTGGEVNITSKHESISSDHGTVVKAIFYKKHIDYTPLGDVISSISTLIQGHPDRDFVFNHKFGNAEVALDTRELRTVLEDVPLDTFEVLIWIRENLTEQYDGFNINQK